MVLRAELRKRLWPNDTIVEFDHSIDAAMNKLRQVLGDFADNPQFIETLARRGYRWMTPVEWVKPGHKKTGEASAAIRGKPIQSLIGKKVSHYRILDVLGGGFLDVPELNTYPAYPLSTLRWHPRGHHRMTRGRADR